MTCEPTTDAVSVTALRHPFEHASAPTYDRAALTPAVVHIGVGGFHRAHQALYWDEIARRGLSTGWGVVGVGLHSPEMGRVLAEQDGLYTVLVRDPDGDDEARVVGVVVDYLFAPDDPERVLATLADERTQLVTLTVTGTAYPTGDVDPDDDLVRQDVEHPERPGTAWGYVVEGLRRRRDAGLGPFTVLSCDNMQHNGAAAQRAVVSTARLRDPELARWVGEQVAFPSSMVDRITPETTAEDREEVEREHGLADAWPVVTERFSQWVVEDRFCAARPPLDQVGVQLVDDVRPYEQLKTRLLNGAHCAIGYLGHLAGYTTTSEAMADPRLRAYVEGYLAEAADLLLEVPGVDLAQYRATLLQRLANPQISDHLTRLCRRGSTKVPAYVLPSLRTALDGDRTRCHLVLALAAWLRHLRGEDAAGVPFDLEDAEAERLQPLAVKGGTDPRPVLTHPLFGSLGAELRLHEELEAALVALERGPLAAAAALVAPELDGARA